MLISCDDCEPIRKIGIWEIELTPDNKFTEENSSLKRNVLLEEIGNSALYFVSNLSSAVTGEIHYVDCGYNIIGMPKKY